MIMFFHGVSVFIVLYRTQHGSPSRGTPRPTFPRYLAAAAAALQQIVTYNCTRNA